MLFADTGALVFLEFQGRKVWLSLEREKLNSYLLPLTKVQSLIIILLTSNFTPDDWLNFC